MHHHDTPHARRLLLPVLAALAVAVLPACDEFDDELPDDLESRDLEALDRETPDRETPDMPAPDLERTDASRGELPETPEVHETLVDGQGHLDKQVIRRIVRAHINEIKHCYNQLLSGDPDAAGRLEVRFTIDETGTVAESTVADGTLEDPALRSCVTTAVRRWKFPKPQGGGKVVVTYPFNFDPA